MGDRTLFDVIVVGAGPGGSNAAAVALRRGLTVAQVDREKFPRVKPCGGGMTAKSFRAVQHDVTEALRGESRAVELNCWGKRTNRFAHSASAILRMVARPEFDNWMVSENLKAPGFRFFDDERVVEISYERRLRVRTTRRVLHGRHLVAADGAYSTINKQFAITRPKGFAVAVEVTISRDRATLPVEPAPCFDFGAIERGYGWIFPKDDHWNVGLYTLGRSKQLREELRAYIAAKGFRVQGDPLDDFAAHQFPYGGYEVTAPAAQVYVVGDAGGFGDAISGEGIYHALESGRIAGETIADCFADGVDHRAYYERLRPSVLADTYLTYKAAHVVYRNVDSAVRMLESPLVWRPFVQGYADGATFAQSARRYPWLLGKSLARGSLRHDRERA